MSFKQNLITFSSRFQGDDFGKSFPLNHFIPVYHTVSDEHLPHLKHIIHYKNIKDFEKDLDFTLKHFQFVNWDEFKDSQTGNFKPKKKIALLTFDDGLREFYDVVAPILERKGIYAINFINPKFIDNKELMFRCKASLMVDVLNNIRNLNPEIYKILETGLSSKEVLKQKIKEISYKNRMILDQIAELLEIDFQEFLQHQKPYMALEQLKKISQKGFGISNHGFDHPLYKDLTLHQQVGNTDQARHYIKQNNFIHESFAFPFTDFGVKQEFFDEVFKNQNLFCSFGCAGLKFDSFSKNFQRIPMENGKVAEQTLKEETAYFNLKKAVQQKYNSPNMITLLCLNKKELESFVNSGEYSTFDFLPITKHRALSQIKNEKADDEDVLLTLAFEGEKLAGYLGTFPDRLKQEIKFAWLSTLYVSENFRGKRIAQQLLEKVFEKFDGKIGITEFTKEAESLYNKTKQFHYITPKTGNRYYFKSDLGRNNSEEKKSLMRFKPIFQFADFVANSVISFNNQFTKTHQINFEIKDFVDEASSIFLEQFEKHRTSKEITWIMKNPWVLEGNSVEKDYLFSSYAKEFKYFWVKIFDEYGNIEACSLLNLRDGHLKISYFFGKRKNFVFFLQNFIRDHKVKVLTSYQTELNESFNKKKFPKIHQKDLERRYLFHKKLLEILPEDFEPKFQDGDGDPVFT